VKHDEWEIKHLKTEEEELRHMEKELERHNKNIGNEYESWGSDGDNGKHHEIHMPALHPHHQDNSSDILKIVGNLTSLMKDKIGGITKTGPAKDHHMGAVLPTHNMFKPGAHPAHKN